MHNIRTCWKENKSLVKVSGTLQVIQKQQWAFEICEAESFCFASYEWFYFWKWGTEWGCKHTCSRYEEDMKISTLQCFCFMRRPRHSSLMDINHFETQNCIFKLNFQCYCYKKMANSQTETHPDMSPSTGVCYVQQLVGKLKILAAQWMLHISSKTYHFRQRLQLNTKPPN